MWFIKSGLKVAVMLAFTSLSAGAEIRLLMFEEEGCPWCARWRAEVGVIYEKTPEGLQAPLVVLDIQQPIPAHYSLKSNPHFTPTFVLIDENQEIGRIEGYPGEDFFWGLLGRMLAPLNAKGSES